ncbi:MAG: BTAD domain-containing putative transcriptional regulator [Candidatus Eisenbacteria bacterium]
MLSIGGAPRRGVARARGDRTAAPCPGPARGAALSPPALGRGVGAFREGRFNDALALVERASTRWFSRRDYLELARDARLAAACAWVTGSAKEVRARLELLLDRCPKREAVARAILLAEIGGLRILGGQPVQARKALADAERVLRGTPHERSLVEVRVQRANLLYSQGQWEQYLEIAHRALAFYRRIGVPGRVQALLINLAEAHTYLGEEGRALSILDEAEAMQSLVMQQNAGLIHLGRARALVERGETEAATRALAVARDTASRQGSRLWELETDLWSGVLDRREGRLEAAERILTRAVEGFREMDAPAWANLAAMELGLVLGLRRRAGSLPLLHNAARASRRLGDSKEVARNLLYQARVLDIAGEDAQPTLRRALRLLEQERYPVLLRKESDLLRALLTRTKALPANLRALVHTVSPEPIAPSLQPVVAVRLLGGMEVTVDGRAITFARRASMELLARLALRLGEAVRREDLAESLWPGAAPGPSRNRFDVALNGARRLVEPHAGPRGQYRILESAAGWCRLAADAVTVDVRDFEAAAQRCEAHLRGLPTAALRRVERELAAAATLYPGDLLPELAHAGWTERERERLRSRFHRITLAHGAACIRLGDAKGAEADAQRVLADDPLEESAEQLLLAALAARREHQTVIRCYRGFGKRMRRELGVQPSPKTTALYEASLRALSDRRPPR